MKELAAILPSFTKKSFAFVDSLDKNALKTNCLEHVLNETLDIPMLH